MNKIKTRVIYILKRLVIVYLVVCTVMWAGQRHLMYLPNTNIKSPTNYGLVDFADITITTKDDVKIQAWYHAAKTNHPTIIYFHGNAGNLSHRVNFFRLLRDASFGVLAIDYRGYGKSKGSPSEEGFYQDARTAIDYAKNNLSLSDKQIIIYGESIGTGVAVQMAKEYEIAALILQAPFNSMTDTVKYHYPWLPVSLLLKDHYNSESKIADIKAPLLLFHGEKDIIVPARLGKLLFSKAVEPKQAVYFPDASHNNMNLREITNAVIKFSKSYKLFN